MEKLSDKNPCNTCTVDRQIGNPYRHQCECDRCLKPGRWKNECVKKLAEYEELAEKKKPIRVPVGQNGSSTDGCPVCKKEFYEKFNFCPNCGQALDWSD